jgi:hypothetical protein
MIQKIVSTYVEAANWFQNEKNRDEAIKIMIDVSQAKPDDVAKSYDFLRRGDYFERTGTISKAKIASLICGDA